jgi:hypothetical protein
LKSNQTERRFKKIQGGHDGRSRGVSGDTLGWFGEAAKVLPQVEELSTIWKNKERGGGVCGQVEKKGGGVE